jgi:uncharacterized protein HemX
MTRKLSINLLTLLLTVGLFITGSTLGQITNPSSATTGSLATAASAQATQANPAVTPAASPTSAATSTAGDAVLNRVASMFQNFGLFITCTVAVIGLGAGIFGFLAYKSVRDFLKDWELRLIRKEDELKDTLKRAHEAEEDAKKSADKAAKSSREIEDTQAIIDRVLKDVDEIRAKLKGAPELQEGREAIAPQAEQKAAGEPSETVSAKEEADVAERLKGKIPGTSGEAKV